MPFISRFRLFCIAACIGHTPMAYAEEDATPVGKTIDKTEVYSESSSLSGSFLSGRFARAQGDRRSAIRYLEQALAADPGNPTILSQLLVLTLTAGEMEQAAGYAETLGGMPGHEPLVDLVLAIEAVREDDFNKAAQQFQKVFAAQESTLWGPLFMAWVDHARGTLKRPLQPSDILPEGQQAPPFLAYQLALVNDMAGFSDMAEKQYELAVLDIARAPFRAVEAAANFYRRQGWHERLMQLKLDYLNAHPDASTLGDTEAAAQAAALMAQETDGTPESPRLVAGTQEGVAEILFIMASVLYSVDAQQDTQLYLRLSLRLRPDFPVAQLLLGSVLEDEGRYAEAAEAYGGVSAESVLVGRALLRKAYMIEKQGRLEEALAMLDTRAADNPTDYDAYIAKGDLLRNRARYGEAVEAYTLSLERIPEVAERHWGIFFARGACLERLGDWERAQSDLRQTLLLSPDQPEVLNYLGYGLLVRGEDAEEARRLIEQAYALQPNAPHIIDSMGWAAYRAGDPESAVQHLEQAIELMPEDPTINDHLGDAYWQIGRKTEARYQWERALTYAPEPALEKAIRRKLKEGLPQVARKRDRHVHVRAEQAAPPAFTE